MWIVGIARAPPVAVSVIARADPMTIDRASVDPATDIRRRRSIEAPRAARTTAAADRQHRRDQPLPPVALCFVVTTINAVIAAVPAWRIARSPRSLSEIRSQQQERTEAEHEAARTDREDHDPGHDRLLRSLARPAALPATTATRRPVPAGQLAVSRAATAATTITDRAPAARSPAPTNPSRHSGMTISRSSQSRRAPIERCRRRSRRPSDAERQAGRDEEATLLGRVGALLGVAVGGRPRGVDDQPGGDDAEPPRLFAPALSERRAVDEQAGVDQQSGEDRRDRAGVVERADRGEVRAAAVDQPAAGPPGNRCAVRRQRRSRSRARTERKPASSGSMASTPARAPKATGEDDVGQRGTAATAATATAVHRGR